MHIHKAVQNVL